MRSRLILSFFAISACSSAGANRSAIPVVRTVDPVGEYEFVFVDDGKPVTGTMTVTGTPGTYAGRIRTETRPEIGITTLTASGPLVTVTADVTQAVLLIRYRMAGDSMSGNWMLRGDGGRFSGRRVRAAARP